jgi:hypothetical protein
VSWLRAKGVLYAGVLCRDDPVPVLKPNRAWLINLDRAAGAGTHWEALWVGASNAYHIDSYGTALPRALGDRLYRRLPRGAKVLSSNSRRQPLKNEDCGLRAITSLELLSSAFQSGGERAVERIYASVLAEG